MQYFGHKKNVEALEARLPEVSLFLGPESVGKWELAEHLSRFWKFDHADILKIYRLTKDNARAAVEFSQVRPRGSKRLVIVRLDQKATVNAQNTLLKALEAGSGTSFILVAEEAPIPTIVSRATLFRFGLLSRDEVAQILEYRRGYSKDRADIIADYAGGQIQTALKYNEAQEGKILVQRALDAIRRKDLSTLESLTPLWGQMHTDLLVKWCYESLTGKWNFFLPDEAGITGTKIPLRILMNLHEDLRPRLVVRAALASVLQG